MASLKFPGKDFYFILLTPFVFVKKLPCLSVYKKTKEWDASFTKRDLWLFEGQ